MKTIKLAIAILVTVAVCSSLSSCFRMHCVKGSGNQISENRKVADFKRLEVSESFKVIIKQDSSTSTVNITADDNLMRYILTSVAGDKLRIYTKHNICSSGQIIIKVPVHTLEEVRTSDAAEVVAEGKIKAQDLHFKLSDGSRVTIDLTATNVTTSVSDGAELDLTGQASSNDIKISDAGKINAKDFVSGKSTVQASDGSFTELNVLNTLNVRGSDGAVVKYHGNPPSVNTSNSDGASVQKAN
jgi:hypothetical protein